MHNRLQSIFIEGRVGRLEAIVEASTADHSYPISFIMCHPHPLQEGTMHNKVVTTTCKAFQQLGVNTIRFNYRGVGQSEGSYGNGVGEIEDLLSIVSWVKAHYPDHAIWLGGFSFGAAVAYSAANEIGAKQLLNIAPGVSRFPELRKHEPSMPWLIIQGEADEVIEPKAVYEWAAQHQANYELIKLPEVGHFFHGRLVELKQMLMQIYQPRLAQ
jgi:alpha/beta superfamily hydrolase